MRKLGIVTLLLALCLVGCSSTTTKKPKDKDQDKNVCSIECDTADMSEYATFKETDHAFLEITIAQSLQLIKDEDFTGILYFGYPTCPWCVEAVPIMNEVAKSYDLSIYSINKKSEDSIANEQGFQEMTTILDEAYGLDVDDKTGEPRLYVPEVVIVNKGKITSHHMGTVDGHDATQRTMNEDEAKLLKSIYKKLFKTIV